MNGKMEESMKENMKMIKNMATENTFGQTEKYIKVNGTKAKCMEKEKSYLNQA